MSGDDILRELMEIMSGDHFNLEHGGTEGNPVLALTEKGRIVIRPAGYKQETILLR